MSGTETTESSTYLFPLLLTFIIRLRSTFALYLLLKFSFSSQLRHKFPSLSPLLTSIHLLPLHAGLVLLASPSSPLPPPSLLCCLPSFVSPLPPCPSPTCICRVHYCYTSLYIVAHWVIAVLPVTVIKSPSTHIDTLLEHKQSDHKADTAVIQTYSVIEKHPRIK